MKRIFLVFILVTAVLFPVFSAYNNWGIPDSSEIRVILQERWFESPLSEVRQMLPEIYANDAGQKFQVRMEESDSTFNIFVAAGTTINVNVYSNKGVNLEQQEVYPGDIPGSWVLIKDKKTEKPIRIRYYFSSNSDVYVQFSPYGKAALADMVIFGNYASKGASTGVPFSAFYTASFQNVLDMTERTLPWDYVTVKKDLYHSIQQDAAVIAENLGKIFYAPDAMYDENNELVRISTGKPFEKSAADDTHLYLSSAGFVKWVADGLVEPLTGSRLKRAPLIVETVTPKQTGYQGVLSQNLNLNFSLDWIRNLSAAVTSVNTGKTYLYDKAGADVTINPFAASISANGTMNTVTFIEDTGYNARILKSLFYVLATTEPGTMYFGAIRVTDRTVMPEVKVFNDCAVFLPYFDSNDRFNCIVFMNGRSLALEDFCTLYSEDFVYLTRARASEEFYPN